MRAVVLGALLFLGCGTPAPLGVAAGGAGPLCSSPPRLIGELRGIWTGMGVDAHHVWVANMNATPPIGRIPKEGGPFEAMARAPDAELFRPPLSDASHLYSVETPISSETIILRAPTGDPAATTEIGRIPSQTDAVAIAVDPNGPFVYWTDEDGRLGRVSKEGGVVALIAETGAFDDDDYNPLVAVHGASVYWVGGQPGRRASDDDPIGLHETCK
jgi:hypothetical protein